MRGISFAGVALALLLNGNPAEAATLRVADFGARGDGRTDDTAAVQRALDAVRSGDELHFEAGRTYVISKSLQMRNKSGYTVVGNGATIKASSSLPANRSADSYMLFILENRNYSWKNLIFDGSKGSRRGPAKESGDQGWYHNIIIRGGADFLFDGVHSYHAYMDGFYVSAVDHKNTNTFPRRGKFINCVAEHNWRTALSIINAYDVEVSGGSYSYSEGDWPMTGIQIEPNPGSVEPGVKGVSIGYAFIVGNKGHGVGVAAKGASQDITVDRSYFWDNQWNGVQIGGGNMTVRNSVFEYIYRGLNSTVLNGTLNTVTRGTIDIGAAQGNNYNASILNNTFREIHVGESAIYIHSLAGQGAQFRGNCFERLSVPGIKTGSSARPMMSDNSTGSCPSNKQLLGW